MREEKRDAGDVHQWRVNALCVVTNDEDWVDWSISRQPVTAYCVAHYYGDHIHRTARDDGISPQNLRVIASEVSDKLDIPQCSNHCVLRFCIRLWHMIKCDFSNFVDYTTFDYRLLVVLPTSAAHERPARKCGPISKTKQDRPRVIVELLSNTTRKCRLIKRNLRSETFPRSAYKPKLAHGGPPTFCRQDSLHSCLSEVIHQASIISWR